MGAVQQRMEGAQTDKKQTEKNCPDFKTVGPRWAKRAAEIIAQSKPLTGNVSGKKTQGGEPKATVNRLTLEIFVDLFEGLQRK